jgi:hypothetical protein
MTDRQTDPTASLGTFEDWNITRPTAVHIMRELARGHYDDSGDTLGGLPAVAGLNIAVIADEGCPDADMIAGILHHVGWLAALLAPDAPTEEQRIALRLIIDATDAWKA